MDATGTPLDRACSVALVRAGRWLLVAIVLAAVLALVVQALRA